MRHPSWGRERNDHTGLARVGLVSLAPAWVRKPTSTHSWKCMASQAVLKAGSKAKGAAGKGRAGDLIFDHDSLKISDLGKELPVGRQG